MELVHATFNWALQLQNLRDRTVTAKNTDASIVHTFWKHERLAIQLP